VGFLGISLLPGVAQGVGIPWGAAANVSNSGAASAPLLARDADGALYAYWWDRFDGMTISLYTKGRWSEPQIAPIQVPRMEDGEVVLDRTTQLPIIDALRTAPVLVADGQGDVHALWLGPARSPTGLSALMYSTLPPGTVTWSLARQLLPSASAWRLVASAERTLHLLFFEPARSADSLPGIYYQCSTDGGATWSARTLVVEAPFVRLVSPAAAHLDLLAANEDTIYAAWEDPRSGRAFFSRSQDGGATWDDPAPVGDGETQATRARFAVSSAGTVLQLWQVGQPGAGQRLYQRLSWDGGDTWAQPQRILPDVTSALSNVGLRSQEDGRILMLVGGRASPPSLAVWDPALAIEAGATGWSLPDIVGESRVAGLPVIQSWRSDLVRDSLTVAGVGDDGDVWTLRRRLSGATWEYPAPIAAPTQAPAVLRASDDWSNATPLAAGAAQPFALVGAPDGRQQAFWWDGAGLKSARFDGQAWGQPLPLPIEMPAGPEGATVTVPLGEAPTIADDGRGHALALWLAAPAAGEANALWYSAMPVGGDVWSTPVALADDVLDWAFCADPAGGVHLLYVRVATQTVDAVEISYIGSAGSAEWTLPQSVATSDLAGWWQGGAVTLTVAADGAGHIIAAWQGASSGPSLSASQDGGSTWSEAILLDDPEARPHLPLLLAADKGEFILMWEPADSMTAVGVYQQHSQDGGLTWSSSQRVLDGPLLATADPSPLYASSGRTMLLTQGDQGRIALRAWLGAQGGADVWGGWSQPRNLDLSFAEPDSDRVLMLSGVEFAVAGSVLGGVGLDQDGRLWALCLNLADLSWASEPPQPWQEPTRLSEGTQLRGPATMVADGQGQFHALWSEQAATGGVSSALIYARHDGVRWTRPAAVLRSPAGGANQPVLTVLADRLHAVWSGGAEGAIYTSSSFTRDAYAAGSWSEAETLPSPPDVVSLQEPHIVAGLDGALHVVYVAPLNEGRGVYYTHSEDAGASWSQAVAVFDAAAAGWAMVAEPTLAVDVDGALYVAWLRGALPIPSARLGVYLAHSHDGGTHWSAPMTLREGAFDAPKLVLSQRGVVHALWRDATGTRVWWQRSSSDGGESWGAATQVRGTRGLIGQIAVLTDWNGTLHLLGAGLSASAAQPTLAQATWRDAQGRWETEGSWLLGRVTLGEEGVFAAFAPRQGRLGALVRVGFPGGEAIAPGWLYTERAIAPVTALPAPVAAREPTPTPGPTPVPTPTPRPMIGVSAPTPAQLGQALDLGVVRIPYLMLAGLLVVALILGAVVVIWNGRRS
jgi:hypothetical protein